MVALGKCPTEAAGCRCSQWPNDGYGDIPLVNDPVDAVHRNPRAIETKIVDVWFPRCSAGITRRFVQAASQEIGSL